MIHFSQPHWEQVKDSHAAFWNGTLDRPLMPIRVRCFDPGRPCPVTPYISQSTCHDFSVSAEQIIDAIDYELSQYAFLGDAYPHVNFNFFGPGVLSAFCGAKLDNSSGRVWFYPQEELPIEEIHIKYDPENRWVRRVKDIYRAGLERWEGNVLLGMPDLGGIMDVIAVLRGSENLLLDLYDAPEEVHRLRKETYRAWMEAYQDLSETLKGNPGYSDWDGLYSETPSYIQQCDFCYMIGTSMFDEFVLPDIRQSCLDLDHVIYHLDGVGELNHLDHILQIPELRAVQWVYGEGKPSARHWIDVYRKIADAGKRIHLIGGYEDYDIVLSQVPNGRFYMMGGAGTVEEAKDILHHFEVPSNADIDR